MLCGLLDARGLPELGHRARLQALAPGQEARALPGRAAGDRALPGAAPPHGALGEAHARPLVRALRPLGCSATAACRRANAFSVPSIDDNESSRSVLAAARVQANAAQAALLGLGRMRGERAAAAVRLRPRHRPARDHHARLQHRDRRGHRATRSRTAGWTSRACSTADQEVAGGVGGRPPASFGVVVRSGGRIAAASQHAVEQGDNDPLELLEAPRGTGRNPNPYPRLPYAGAFETPARARHRARQRDLDPDHATASPRPSSRPSGA